MKRLFIIIVLLAVGAYVPMVSQWGYVHEFGHVLIGGGSIEDSHTAVVKRDGPLVSAMGFGMEVIFPAIMFILLTRDKKWGLIGWMFPSTVVFAFLGGLGDVPTDWNTAGAYEVFIGISCVVFGAIILFGIKRIREEISYQRDQRELKEKKRKEVLAYWLQTP